MNTVLAGAYQEKKIFLSSKTGVYVYLGKNKAVFLDKQNVFRYELVERDSEIEFNVDYIGFFAEASSRQINAYRVIIYFRSGEKSLIEVDQKTYKTLTVDLFGAEDYIAERAIVEQEQVVTNKKGNHVGARIAIFLVIFYICNLIVDAYYPVEGGVVTLDWMGSLFLLGIPILATIFLPKIIFKKRKKE